LLLVEVAPGIDLERDIRSRLGFPLHVAPDLRPMDLRLFLPEPMGVAADWERE
jgi:propionate CoA-transferase